MTETNNIKGVFGTWNVEDWYDTIKSFTFETYFIPLNVEQGTAILHNYEFLKKGEKRKFTENDEKIMENVSLIH